MAGPGGTCQEVDHPVDVRRMTCTGKSDRQERGYEKSGNKDQIDN